MKPTPIATPVKAFEAIAPATNLKPITNNHIYFYTFVIVIIYSISIFLLLLSLELSYTLSL